MASNGLGNMQHMRNVKNEAPSPAQWQQNNGQETGTSSSTPDFSNPQMPQQPPPQQPPSHAVDRRRLEMLIKDVDPLQQVDEDAESCLLDIADDFIDTVLSAACQVAKLRKSTCLELKDVQYVLDTQFNLWMPGYGNLPDSKQTYKRPAPSDAHKQRMAVIRKMFKTH